MRTPVPELVDRWRARRLQERRDRQLPEALERMAAATRAGRSLAAAVGEVAHTTAPPLGDELRALAAELDGGLPVEAAVAARTGIGPSSSDRDLALAALALGARAGGEVGRALDRVAATLRERRELRGEARALATQARASAGVLTVAPLAFTVLVSAVEPGAIAFLLTTPAGWGCLGIGLALDAAGALWMARTVERAT